MAIMVLPAIPLQYSLTVEGEYVVKMRLEPAKVSPAAYHAMLGLESFVSKSSKLEQSLLELVKMKASQINGCAFSIDMHSKDARVNGETEQRLYALSAWRGTTFFTNRERAALAWTEALTLITEGHAPDEVYAEVRKEFGEEGLVNLSLAIITINGWNRLAIGCRTIPGEYQPHRSVKPVIAAHHRKDRSDAQHEEDHPLCIYLYLRICHGNACPASKYAPYETAAGGAG
jgi:AhpD family alkylhydroperoxidase